MNADPMTADDPTCDPTPARAEPLPCPFCGEMPDQHTVAGYVFHRGNTMACPLGTVTVDLAQWNRRRLSGRDEDTTDAMLGEGIEAAVKPVDIQADAAIPPQAHVHDYETSAKAVRAKHPAARSTTRGEGHA